MKKRLSALRRLQWQLTLSYTLVTVGALLVVGLAVIAGSLLSQPVDATTRSVSIGIVTNRIGDGVKPYLEQWPPDLPGLAARLHGFRSMGAALANAPDLPANWREGNGPLFFVLSGEGRLLGTLPPLSDPAELGQPFALSSVPGLQPAMDSLRMGTGTLGDVGGRSSGRDLQVSAIRGSDGSYLGTVVGLAGPNAWVPSNYWGVLAPVVQIFAIILVFAAAIGSVFGYLTSRGLSRRLGRLAVVTAAWSRADFSLWARDSSEDELGQLARQIDGTGEQLQNLLRVRQELATLRERERLARDLHDSVKQQVFAIAMQLAAAKALLPNDRDAALARLGEAEALTRQAQRELALLIQELRPAELAERGLAGALRDYAASWSRQTGIAVTWLASNAANLLPTTEQALFRVAQEALANVARHSGARTVRLSLDVADEAAALTIADDGRGFDLAAARGQGVGLASMRERLQELGGSLDVTSAAGEGTQVVARCPLRGGQALAGQGGS
jgi:two-component system, NarL family, sensor histidine kinase LiaS